MGLIIFYIFNSLLYVFSNSALEFDYDEFNEADLKVDLLFEKKTTLLELNFNVGLLSVPSS